MKHLSQLLKLKKNTSHMDVSIKAIQTDSRKIKPGDLFMAYPGLKVDGRNYIEEALKKKVAAVLYEAHHYQPSFKTDVPLIPFKNLQYYVGKIAACFHDDPSRTVKVIGITGTNGKTSCAYFIAQALKSQGISCGFIGTLGYGFLGNLRRTSQTTPNPIQLQQVLANMRKLGAKVIAMEASSHALHQRRVQGVHFDIAVLTQLSQDHLNYHGDIRSYACAKELLFQQEGLRYGVVNCDDTFGKRIIANYHQKLTIIGYSINGLIDNRISSVIVTAMKPIAKGFSVTVQTPWGKGIFTTSLLGRFIISNLLAVLSVLCLCEIPFDKVLVELSQLYNAPGRMQMIDSKNKQRHPQVVVDYAHTPDALEKSLTALREYCQGRLICVFGCGGDRDRGKRLQMASVAEQYADRIILTNDNPRTESPLKIIEDIQIGLKNKRLVIVKLDRAEAIRYAVQTATINDIVLIAGKGHEITQTIGEQTLPFNDVKEAKKALWLYDEIV